MVTPNHQNMLHYRG